MSCGRFGLLVAFVFFCVGVPMSSAGQFEAAFRADVINFVHALEEGQRKNCLHKLNDPRRWRMHYPGGIRPGIQINQLNEGQRALMTLVLSKVLSPYGMKMASAIASQDASAGEDALGKYWITCFGDPRAGDFAFRLAEHHLTIVHLELAQGKASEFGPILLGANPPNLWQEDEEILMRAWELAANAEALLPGQKGIAGKPMPMNEGVRFDELNRGAQQILKSAWERRLSIFSAPLRERIAQLHSRQGGWEQSRIAFYNEAPAKRCIDGGRWDFKCGLPGMVWDFEGSRGHIHMSLWVKEAEQ